MHLQYNSPHQSLEFDGVNFLENVLVDNNDFVRCVLLIFVN